MMRSIRRLHRRLGAQGLVAAAELYGWEKVRRYLIRELSRKVAKVVEGWLT